MSLYIKEIVFEGMDDLFYSKIDPQFSRALSKYADRLVRQVRNEIENRNLVATGKMKRGVRKQIKQLAGKYVVDIINKQPYMNYINWGTRPHKPPINKLQDWAGIRLGDSSLATAFKIQKTIGEVGINENPFLDFVFRQEENIAAKWIESRIKF